MHDNLQQSAKHCNTSFRLTSKKHGSNSSDGPIDVGVLASGITSSFKSKLVIFRKTFYVIQEKCNKGIRP